jgi:hypothetical protein
MSQINQPVKEDTHMADLPPYKTPRWVKIVGIIALVLVLLIGIIMVTGIGGEHGPGRHIPGGNTRPSSVQESIGSVGVPGRDHEQAGMRGQITIALTLLPTEVQQL